MYSKVKDLNLATKRARETREREKVVFSLIQPKVCALINLLGFHMKRSQQQQSLRLVNLHSEECSTDPRLSCPRVSFSLGWTAKLSLMFEFNRTSTIVQNAALMPYEHIMALCSCKNQVWSTIEYALWVHAYSCCPLF